LYSAAVSGMKKGSGVFSKTTAQWSCDVCSRTKTSTSKPPTYCSDYGKAIMVPNSPGAIQPPAGSPPGTAWTHGPNDWNPIITP